MSEAHIEVMEDRWVLRGLRTVPVLAVSHTPDGSGLSLTLEGGVELAIVGPVRITHGPAAAPGAVALPVGEADALVGATVLSAVAFRSGSLRVVFSTGHHLNVRGSDPGVRVDLRKPGEFTWVAQQGAGELTNLDSDSP
nr:DUF6188 family protein [Streptomyces sp. NBC_00830]